MTQIRGQSRRHWVGGSVSSNTSCIIVLPFTSPRHKGRSSSSASPAHKSHRLWSDLDTPPSLKCNEITANQGVLRSSLSLWPKFCSYSQESNVSGQELGAILVHYLSPRYTQFGWVCDPHIELLLAPPPLKIDPWN